jgi:hypothetical protein
MFIIDIFVFYNFRYFYNTLILLLIPLIYYTYIYMVKSQSIGYREYSELYFDIIKHPGSSKNIE